MKDWGFLILDHIVGQNSTFHMVHKCGHTKPKQLQQQQQQKDKTEKENNKNSALSPKKTGNNAGEKTVKTDLRPRESSPAKADKNRKSPKNKRRTVNIAKTKNKFLIPPAQAQ